MPVARASSRCPISQYGSEYSVRPTFACTSGATFGRLQVAASNAGAAKPIKYKPAMALVSTANVP